MAHRFGDRATSQYWPTAQLPWPAPMGLQARGGGEAPGVGGAVGAGVGASVGARVSATHWLQLRCAQR